MSSLGLISLVVDDYDRGIRHFVDDLGFDLVCDIDEGRKRWVVFLDDFGNKWDLLEPA